MAAQAPPKPGELSHTNSSPGWVKTSSLVASIPQPAPSLPVTGVFPAHKENSEHRVEEIPVGGVGYSTLMSLFRVHRMPNRNDAHHHKSHFIQTAKLISSSCPVIESLCYFHYFPICFTLLLLSLLLLFVVAIFF